MIYVVIKKSYDSWENEYNDEIIGYTEKENSALSIRDTFNANKRNEEYPRYEYKRVNKLD